MAQQVLAKNLAPLELGGRCARTENPQLRIGKRIDDALGQRQLGPNDGQPDVVLRGKLDEPRKIGRRYVDILGIKRRAGVARSHEHALHPGALRELPGQRVFAPAIANDQHIHRTNFRSYGF